MEEYIELSEANLVLTRGVSSYKEVVEDIPFAKYIYIATYNIDKRESHLFKTIGKARKDAVVKIITNIPSYNYNFTTKHHIASQDLEKYVEALKRIKLPNYTYYFNFYNHSKIIMTENIAYIGSANFSEASTDNLECGVIIRDPVAIKELTNNFFKAIEAVSTPYSNNEWIVKAISTLVKTKRSFDSVISHIEPKIYSTDPSGEIRYFDRTNDTFSVDDINILVDLIEDESSAIEHISHPGVMLIIDQLKEIRKFLDYKTINEYAKFDISDNAIEIFGGYATAHQEPEELEHYQSISQYEAITKFEALAERAEAQITHVLDNIYELPILCDKAISALDARVTR